MIFRRMTDIDGEEDRPTHVKVLFHLEQDEDGYPPSGLETLWAEPVGEEGFRLDNIPFYARDVAVGDVVEAREEGGQLRFERVVERSGHSTLRVVVFEAADMQGLRDSLHELGCATELSHLPRLVSVDVPPDVEMRPVRQFLVQGREAGWLDLETGYVGDPHVDAFN